MARIVLPLIGTGTDADPYRVGHPTYTMVPGGTDYLNKRAVVDVPDALAPNKDEAPATYQARLATYHGMPANAYAYAAPIAVDTDTVLTAVAVQDAAAQVKP